MYVCMYACIYVCVCMSVCVYVCMYVCSMYVCMDVCMYVHRHVTMVTAFIILLTSKKGGLPVVISTTVHPRDQMSASGP